MNFIPAGMDSYSTSDAQMQIMTDPFPASVLSRPTSLAGEIERLRFVINGIKGTTNWYETPAASVSNINTRLSALEGNLTAPIGTIMLFFQAAPPNGWVQGVFLDGFMLRLATNNGGQHVNGTDPAGTIVLAHSHTVTAHTHTTPDHQHVLATTGAGGLGPTGTHNVFGTVGGTTAMQVDPLSGIGNTFLLTSKTDLSGNGTSGSSSPTTDSKLTDLSLSYANIIYATKA